MSGDGCDGMQGGLWDVRLHRVSNAKYETKLPNARFTPITKQSPNREIKLKKCQTRGLTVFSYVQFNH